jgi:hypothetical protein
MHLKVFVKLKKNPKNPLVWAKKPKKTQKTQKNPKKTKKKPLGWVFFKKTRVFSNPGQNIFREPRWLAEQFLCHMWLSEYAAKTSKSHNIALCRGVSERVCRISTGSVYKKFRETIPSCLSVGGW